MSEAVFHKGATTLILTGCCPRPTEKFTSFQKIVDKAKRDERQGIEKTVNLFFEKEVKGATHLISAKDWWTLVKSIKNIGEKIR